MTHFKRLSLSTATGLIMALGTPALAASDLRGHSAVAPTTAALNLMGESADREINAALETRITSGKVDKTAQKEFAPGVARALRHAYASRNFAPIWTRDGAADFRIATKTLFAHGISADDVFTNNLDKLITTRFDAKSPKARAKADVKLTLASLRMAQAVSGTLGDEGEMDDPSRDSAMRSSLTDYIIKSGQGRTQAELRQLAPTHPQYKQLQDALTDYRQIKADGGWLAIPGGELIETGDTDRRVSALRTRLAVEGFTAPTPANPDLYDLATENALKAFQRRHGLEDDGVVGGNTLEAINESVESKIARIAETMHRWRQHGDLGERYILANIPSYTAEGWDKGRREVTQRTVVGSKRNATPTFSDSVEYVVANPKWYVPVSIARRQKLSKLRRDASYAPRKGYQVIDLGSGQAVSSASVDWNDPDVLSKYRLVQQPGANNALGELKIIFPNQYSVYLHGTPTMHLFDEAQRAFSSGCVRLEDPEAMARWIAKKDDGVTPGEITEQLDSGERDRFYLEGGMPVHITYHTVVVNDAGAPVFYRDIYDRLDEIETVEKMARLDPLPSMSGTSETMELR